MLRIALVLAQALLRGTGSACPSVPVPVSPLLPEVAVGNSSVHGAPGDGGDGALAPRNKIAPGTLPWCAGEIGAVLSSGHLHAPRGDLLYVAGGGVVYGLLHT